MYLDDRVTLTDIGFLELPLRKLVFLTLLPPSSVSFRDVWHEP